MAAVFVLSTGVYPWAQQKIVVEPNELQKEAPYIADNIELTRQAYGLNVVQPQPFEVKNQLDADVLARNSSTIDNIRLWDYRPLQSTYGSLQTLRPYYRFLDVDIDRCFRSEARKDLEALSAIFREYLFVRDGDRETDFRSPSSCCPVQNDQECK